MHGNEAPSMGRDRAVGRWGKGRTTGSGREMLSTAGTESGANHVNQGLTQDGWSKLLSELDLKLNIAVSESMCSQKSTKPKDNLHTT